MYPFVDERLPLSVNGLERCELNIDFIRSLVAVAVRSADSPCAGADGICWRNKWNEEMSEA